MARSKSSQRDNLNSTPSLTQLLANSYPRPAPVLLPVPSYNPTAVLSFGDRRLFQPDRAIAPPAAVRRSAARLVVGNTLDNTRFAEPRLVALCVRRKMRKQVLFALKRTRKGAGSKRRKNFWSTISC